jgi:hypothetical protein
MDNDARDSGARIFLLKGFEFLFDRLKMNCPIRSSERWRRKQRAVKMPTLSDVRHQISRLVLGKLRI